MFPMAPANAENVNWEKLSQTFIRYMSLPSPRGGKFIGNDVDVDLYQEDYYILGLVDTFMESGSMERESIVLHSSIDRILRDYDAVSESENTIVSKFVSYRRHMVELAQALSLASNTPIEWK